MPRDLNVLMIAVQNDDPEAMTDLFNVLKPRLAGFFLKCRAPDSDVDDLVQLALIKIWKSRDRFKPESQTASAWILTVTVLQHHIGWHVCGDLLTGPTLANDSFWRFAGGVGLG